MSEVTIDNITDVVLNSMSKDMDARSREIMTSLVRHLHDFAREAKVTHAEWLQGIEMMTAAARLTDDKRNEFILVSDVLGLESLVDAISHGQHDDATESAVLGPFFREGAPVKRPGDTIAQRGEVDGPSALLEGRITNTSGAPVANATINVWCCAPNGMYEQQDPEQPDMNLRGQFTTDNDGRYKIRAVRPVSYPIPYDGPAGDILQIMGRHPYRPAHIHMMIDAPGHPRLVSQLYDRTDEYVETDSVYSVKGSLLLDFKPAPTGTEAQYHVEHNVVLQDA